MNNDFVTDYFKKKRKQIFIGIIFFISFLMIVYFIQIITSNKSGFVAKINIDNIILENDELLRDFDLLENDNRLQGLLVSINSPGGTVVSSQQLYNRIKNISKNVPVVISMKEIAASGGYMVSLAGNKIFCYDGTLTGSVGVILPSVNIEKLLNNFGIDPLVIKSGNLKAVPNPLESFESEGEEHIKEIINNMHKNFIQLVNSERKITPENMKIISDGRIFTGIEAKKVNLIDEIGTEQDALNWLKKEAGIKGELNLINYSKKEKISSLFNFSFLDRVYNKISFYPSGLYAIWSINYE